MTFRGGNGDTQHRLKYLKGCWLVAGMTLDEYARRMKEESRKFCKRYGEEYRITEDVVRGNEIVWGGLQRQDGNDVL